MKNKQNWLSFLGLALILCFAAAQVPAQVPVNNNNRKHQAEGRKDAREAEKVLREIMNVPDKAIPRELLERAHAIAVFPKVVKAAFIVGGRGGDGVVARRTAAGWSAPVFYNMGGASFGAQIGGSSTDYVMLFMNEGALQELLNDQIEFGGSVSAVAGPVGRTLGASTNLTLDAGILTWSRSKGAFIGASINGAALRADNNVNEALYGMKAKDVMENLERINLARTPTELRAFTATVTRYAGATR